MMYLLYKYPTYCSVLFGFVLQPQVALREPEEPTYSWASSLVFLVQVSKVVILLKLCDSGTYTDQPSSIQEPLGLQHFNMKMLKHDRYHVGTHINR